MDLNLPTVDVDIQFSNFTYGPPPSSVFDIPTNCTQIEFKSRLYSIYSHTIIKNRDVGMLC